MQVTEGSCRESPRVDRSGLQRTVVIGTTGSGKTTVAVRLATTLGAPYVELDAINWQPNWVGLMDTDVSLFRSRVAEAVRSDTWVVDGNYSAVRDLIWPRATAIVWLDYSFSLILWRLLRRTLQRTLGGKTLWAGNRETVWRAFSHDSILLWAFKSHWRRRRSLCRLFKEPEQAHFVVIRMKRSADTERWLRGLPG
ncbi:MAG: AAA family ATPase [Holophagales bacterium]|nr:AAA family ATPase [Holophagales bacterium]